MTDTLAPTSGNDRAVARVDLLNRLAERDYAFVSPTPSTHRLVAGRLPEARPGDLRDVFGWGRPFRPSSLEPGLFDALRAAGGLIDDGDRYRSAVRVSTLDDRLHLHSARSASPDAVFLGPDSYRFVRFLDAVLKETALPRSVLDVGAGAGAGALAVAARAPGARVVAGDVNPLALGFLAANAAHAGLSVETVEGPGPEAAASAFDLIIANPPYIADGEGRTYRDGGGALGADLALRWIEAGLARLEPGGRFALYSGSPIVEGRDLLRGEIARLAQAAGADLAWEELDPDVFGGTLRQDAYRQVERIAAIGAVVRL